MPFETPGQPSFNDAGEKATENWQTEQKNKEVRVQEAKQRAGDRIAAELNSEEDGLNYSVENSQDALIIRDRGEMQGYISNLVIHADGEGAFSGDKIIRAVIRALVKDGVSVLTDGEHYFAIHGGGDNFLVDATNLVHITNLDEDKKSATVSASGYLYNLHDIGEDGDGAPFIETSEGGPKIKLTYVETI